MTESQWLSSANPAPMLRHLGAKASARKLQLLGVACCRLIADHFDERMGRLVDITERYAEGEASHGDWQAALRDTIRLVVPPDGTDPTPSDSSVYASRLALFGLFGTPPDAALEPVLNWVVACAARAAAPGQVRAAEKDMRRRQADLCREIFGNPFLERTVVPEWMSTGGSGIFPGWMIRVSETAKGLADGVQADQAFERLPILADALEEAGCTDTDLLAHLREPGLHVRGCWALDLVLGKG